MTLRLGLLNMMPDKALAVTDRQFARLFGAGGYRKVELVPFTLPSIERGPEATGYIARNYCDVAGLGDARLDVLAISGANVSDPVLARQGFWQPLLEVLSWAERSGVPTLCSCLATHAVLEERHGQMRQPVPAKIWGVYSHRAALAQDDLLAGLAAEIPVPHSRHNDVSAEQFAAAGYDVVLASATAGVHLAVERSRRRWLLLQGHPEYEAVSLLKEYKREVYRWQHGERSDYPPLPAGYFGEEATGYLSDHRHAKPSEADFPEARVAAMVRNTWTEPAVQVVNNWLTSLA